MTLLCIAAHRNLQADKRLGHSGENQQYQQQHPAQRLVKDSCLFFAKKTIHPIVDAVVHHIAQNQIRFRKYNVTQHGKLFPPAAQPPPAANFKKKPTTKKTHLPSYVAFASRRSAAVGTTQT